MQNSISVFKRYTKRIYNYCRRAWSIGLSEPQNLYQHFATNSQLYRQHAWNNFKPYIFDKIALIKLEEGIHAVPPFPTISYIHLNFFIFYHIKYTVSILNILARKNNLSPKTLKYYYNILYIAIVMYIYIYINAFKAVMHN